MKISSLFTFVATFFILHGIWQFIWLKLATKGYKEFKNEGESFLDYCVREFNSLDWKIRKKLSISWFYNSRLFRIFIILKGTLLVLLGVAFIVAYFLIKNTEYGVWLDIKI